MCKAGSSAILPFCFFILVISSLDSNISFILYLLYSHCCLLKLTALLLSIWLLSCLTRLISSPTSLPCQVVVDQVRNESTNYLFIYTFHFIQKGLKAGYNFKTVKTDGTKYLGFLFYVNYTYILKVLKGNWCGTVKSF